MANTIKIKNSNTAGKAPQPADLEVAELAVNLKDKKLYTKEPGGTVIEVGGTGGGDCFGPGECKQQDLGTVAGALTIDTDNGRTILMAMNGTVTGVTVTDNASPDVGWMRWRVHSNGGDFDFGWVSRWFGNQPTGMLAAGDHIFDFYKLQGQWYGKYEGISIDTAGKRPFRMTIVPQADPQNFTLPITGLNAACEVDWGDGNKETLTGNLAAKTARDHTYNGIAPGTEIHISITGTCELGYGAGNSSSLDKPSQALITRIDAWGDTGTKTLNGLCWEAVNLVYVAPGAATGEGDITGVTQMQHTFENCTSLRTVPLLDTSKVESFSRCFAGSGLERMVAWDTSAAKTMDLMFQNCKSLVYVPPLHTGNVTNMLGMFVNCEILPSLPMMDTAKVANMRAFIDGCKALTTIPPYDMSKVTNAQFFARNCTSLMSVPKFDWSLMQNIGQAFKGCSSLISFPAIDMPECTDANNAWVNCTSLQSFPAIDLRKCKNLSAAWQGCSAMRSFGLIKLAVCENLVGAWAQSGIEEFPLINTATVTNFQYAWATCAHLKVFPSLNMSKAENMVGTWEACSSLETFPRITFPATIQAKATSVMQNQGFGYCFYNCSKLTTFPANCFRSVKTGAFKTSFDRTALTTQSKAHILQDLDISGVATPDPEGLGYTPVITITRGTPIAGGDAADVQKQKLAAKGWDVTQVQ